MKALFKALVLVAVTVIPSISWGQGNPANGLIMKSADGYEYYNQKYQWSIDVPQTFKIVQETPDAVVFGDGAAMISVFSAKQDKKPITPSKFLSICKLERLKRSYEKVIMQGVEERSCVLLTNNKKRGYVFFQNAFLGKRFATVAFIEYRISHESGHYTSLERNINHFKPGIID